MTMVEDNHSTSKNILILAFDFPPNWGGVATYSWEIAHNLHQQGHNVTVITSAGRMDSPPPFKVERWPLGKSGLIASFHLAWRLRRYLMSHAFDFCLCTLWLPDGVGLWMALQSLSLPLPYAISIHAMEIVEAPSNWRQRIRGLFKGIKQSTIQNAHRLLCVSEFSRQLLVDQVDLQPQQAVVIHNGANPQQFQPGKKEKDFFPRLLSACRLQPHKGIDRVIKNLATVITQFPDLKYFISGDGPERVRLQQLAKDCGVEDSIIFLGKISEDELREQMQRAHLFVMLSRQSGHQVEGFGLVFLEAALCGTASLGGDSGGIPDAIQVDKTGWLVTPDNDHDIQQKLIAILSDRSALNDMSIRAEQITRQERTWRHVTQKILDAMESA